jgi:hypothetical protein
VNDTRLAMKRFTAFACLLAFLLTACMRGPNADQLAALHRDAPQLFSVAPLSGPLPPEQWPPSVSALEPKRVHADPEGIYIVTSEFFVQEKGIFLPRSPGFRARQGTDPQYEPIAEGVFAYRIEG